ncbi:MAG TPA: sigma-70 family RNA polymerase sigma factor [Candidatus Paceibacterota bacterium]|jgi:RNA polymerase sigma-70 factor (ECF subfamily)|nr:sigma-70 family RNA polymerase sigma factor [Candidatus Paceibacterota bacterium]
MRTNPNSPTDEELIRNFKSGDDKSFGILVERYSQKLTDNIFFHLPSSLRDPLLIEDILQDVFINAMKGLKNRRYLEAKKFEGWICTISYNRTMDYVRMAKKKQVVPLVWEDRNRNEHAYDVTDGENREIAICRQEDALRLREKLDRLRPEQREVVYLRYFKSLSFKEIRETLGRETPLNTYLGRARYGLINLRKLMKEELEKEEEAKILTP